MDASNPGRFDSIADRAPDRPIDMLQLEDGFDFEEDEDMALLWQLFTTALAVISIGLLTLSAIAVVLAPAFR